MDKATFIQNRRNYINLHNEELRKSVITMLGGECHRCGFSDIRALQIDHVNGGGGKELREIGNGKVMTQIMALPIEEARSKYQVLCANCNWIKKAENGEV